MLSRRPSTIDHRPWRGDQNSEVSIIIIIGRPNEFSMKTAGSAWAFAGAGGTMVRIIHAISPRALHAWDGTRLGPFFIPPQKTRSNDAANRPYCIEVSQSLSQQPVGKWERIMAQSTALDHPLIPVYTLSLVSPLFDRRFSSLLPLVDDANRPD